MVLVLSFVLFSQASLNLDFLQPENLGQTLVFVALSVLIFLLFVALTFVLARNLLKLLAERRIGVLGSRFRTRMVVGGLVLSFLPTIFLFLFAYVLMNRTIDKWFSRPIDELREDTAHIAQLLSEYAARNANAEATTLANDPDVQAAFRARNFSALHHELDAYLPRLQGGFAVLLRTGRAAFTIGQPPGPLAPEVLTRALEMHAFQLGNLDYIAADVPVEDGRVLVALPLPARFKETLAHIDQSQRRYFELNQQRRQIRRLYMQLLLLLTVLMLFASTWLSLFMARLVTRPVAALAEATREISGGNLQYRVEVAAADELGELVSSFNRMAAELEHNREQLESSRAALETRRREIETILENIPTAVLSLDPHRRMMTSNEAFERMVPAAAAITNATLPQLFPAAVSADLERLLRRADRLGTAEQQMELNGLQVAVTVAPLQHDRARVGYVLVIEDLSDLLKAQKQLAWREVARRVAHEIKNPLTPIALSAERIRRHLDRPGPPDTASLAVMQGCAETITGAVETVRTLVDEFSTLARFPAAQPQPTNLNQVIESALGMFNGRLDDISLRTAFGSDLPPVMADPESIKRVVANLVDNAAEAMQDAVVREIFISTALVNEPEKDAVEIIVADTGHGVTAELKEKLFLPYFSTKDRGTGLGLAIVSRIVEEHQGTVRVEENQPVGTRFIVELPVAGAGATRHG